MAKKSTEENKEVVKATQTPKKSTYVLEKTINFRGVGVIEAGEITKEQALKIQNLNPNLGKLIKVK